MLKLSFDKKKLEGEPIKVQVFNDVITKVTIKGMLIRNTDNPIPLEVDDFINLYPGVDAIYCKGEYAICATGVSKRSSDDTYNEVIGYRIAESRAKIKLYKFMFSLCNKYKESLSIDLYGNPTAISSWHTTKGILGDIIKYNKLLTIEQGHLNILIYDIDTKSPQ